MTPAYCVIPPQQGSSFILKKGQKLKVVSPEAGQVSDLFCYNLHDRKESFSAGRSLDYNDTIYLTTGHVLYSNRSSKMLKIIEDSCGVHDLLMTPCSLKMFQVVAQNEDYHPSCHENLATHLKEFGIEADDVSTTFNIFMNVKVDPEGRVKIHPPTVQAGEYITFEAQMDLLVGLTACSHEETNGHRCKPIHYAVGLY